ncbi:MAG TPA: hypothetical protein VGM56_08780 [Byssovorax sp.]|jgi:hypothetical protein
MRSASAADPSTRAGLFAVAALLCGCSSGSPTTLIIGGSDGAGGDAATTATSTTATGSGGAPTTSAATGGGSTGQARAYFLATVYPELADNPLGSPPHSCIDCHGTPSSNGAPSYLDSDPATAYLDITNFPGFLATPANSVLIQRGSVQHTGPAMSASMITDVSHWLDLEVQERGLGTGSAASTGSGGAAPETLESAIAEYGRCMDEATWLAPPMGTGLDQLPNMKTDDNSACKSCHSSGQGGNWLSSDTTTTPPDPDNTFQKNQQFPYVLRQVTGTVDAQGNFAGLVAAQRWIDKGSEACDPTVQECHKTFTLPTAMVDGIDSFVDATIQKWSAHQCGAGGGAP